MSYHQPFIILFMFMANTGFSQSLGIFDQQLDVGDPQVPGTASYSPANQTYTISSAGENMWFDQDQFHYLWTTLQGDFILRAELQFLGKGVNPHRKTGWIIKNDLDNTTRHVNAAVHGDGLTSLQYRKTDGGETLEVVSPDSLPDVIQLERRGDRFIMSTAKFGEELTRVELDDMAMDNEVYVGLYVCSHEAKIVETALFRNVRIIKPASPDFRPYRDYIGSRLEMMEVATGNREVLYSSKHSIQAPNWMPDGKRLIYNSKGYLYTYSLEDHRVRPLNTGFAIHNNNDHALSFDGELLGISNHDPENEGASSIFFLPATGDSLPVAVTRKGRGNSYLHGWSPDKKHILFTGERGGQYDIYKVEVISGKETQLTDESTLDDGAEYSPDGRYIYFNSARTGTMQLWRMRSDGSKPEQLTFDKHQDWFPHVSPDGQWIVFISFPADTDPSDHPFYRQCLLRLMPTGGGKPSVIGYIYGGQGSINVPSWSPDSKWIAFVTNSD